VSVVVAVLLVVAKVSTRVKFSSRCPSQRATAVDPEVVRVAVDVGDRSPEVDDAIAERGQEPWKPSG